MKRMKKLEKIFRITFAIVFLGTVCQLNCLGTVARQINPCGTIIACDPLEYDYLVYDLPDNAPDWNLDPTCTLPGFCGYSPFPFGTTGTGTTTGTTTGNTGQVVP